MASRKLPVARAAVSRVSPPARLTPTALDRMFANEPPPRELPPSVAVVGGDESYEIGRVELPSWPRNAAVTVYTTRRRWRSVAVYVQPTVQNPADGVVGGDADLTSGNMLSIYVYAVNNGIRTCVATARRLIFDDDDLPPFAAYVISTRAVAERFEVVAHLRQPAATGNLAGGVLINVIATDDVSGPEDAPAGIWVRGSDLVIGAVGSSNIPAPFTVDRVLALNGAGAGVARWLHIYDTIETASVSQNGLVPMISAPIGDDGAPPTAIDLRGYLFTRGPRIIASSTDTTTTRTNDCLLSALIR